MQQAVVKGNVETNTFAYMFIGAEHMLEQAEANNTGQLYNIVSCITYCAFTIEAYFNHFGNLQYENWDKIERTFSKRAKYKKFCNKIGLKVDFNQAPYSTMNEVFSYRDQMAHGKSTIEFVTKNVEVEPEQPNRFTAGADWQEYANIENAKKAIEHTREIICELHRAVGFEENPFSDLGSGLLAVQLV